MRFTHAIVFLSSDREAMDEVRRELTRGPIEAIMNDGMRAEIEWTAIKDVPHMLFTNQELVSGEFLSRHIEEFMKESLPHNKSRPVVLASSRTAQALPPLVVVYPKPDENTLKRVRFEAGTREEDLVLGVIPVVVDHNTDDDE